MATASKRSATKVATRARPKPRATVWASTAALEAALCSGGDGLDESFDRGDRAHQKAVLGLSRASLVTLIALLGGPAGLRRRIPNSLAVLAQEWAMGKRARDALTIFDALVELDHQETGAYAVALWAVIDDNTHLGVDRERALRYLKHCLPHGKALADIYFNAMFVALELGDIDGAHGHLKKAIAGGFSPTVAREQLETEKLCAPVRDDARFRRLVGAPAEKKRTGIAVVRTGSRTSVSLDQIDQCLGLPVDAPALAQLLSALGVEQVKAASEGSVRVKLDARGLLLVFAPRDGAVLALSSAQLFAGGEEGYQSFSGDLRGGIRFSDAPAAVRAKLGKPTKIMKDFRIDQWVARGRQLQLRYTRALDGIAHILLAFERAKVREVATTIA